MHHTLLFLRALALGLLVAAAIPCRASVTILPGFDLFETTAPTTFNGVPFVGVPLGTYDFGGGPVATGTTDTIVERLGPAIGPAPATIPIELVALQLVSASPVDMGAGLGLYYITLQSNRSGGDPPPGPSSTGQMLINFGPEGMPHGTFNSFFDVWFDLRYTALNGPIVFSNNLTMTSNNVPWSHIADPNAPLINGVNNLLNTTDISNDFWPITPFTESHPSGAQHSVITPTPEPSIPVLSLLGLGAILFRRRRA